MKGTQRERAEAGKPVYHNRECQKQASRVELACAGCGTSVWRYKSQLGKNVTKRVFCGDCRDAGVGFKPRQGTTRPCSACGAPVYRRPGEDDGGPRYCDSACYGESLKGERVARVERPCEVCGTVMRLTPDQRSHDVRTCSPECKAANRRRKPGERYIDPKGYAIITTPDGRSMGEHRYVMEQQLGRKLLPTETVHHKTGGMAGRSNNDPQNLELWTGRHPKGHRIEDVVMYAREMLAMYGTADERTAYESHRQAVVEDQGGKAPEDG